MTKVKLELLTDYDMILMIKAGIRGGVSMISNRYSKANNKYMECYDPEKESSFVTYLDANNLYGWAMSQKLPVSDFKWMTSEELQRWDNIPCIVDVDLEYPKGLHDLHNDYPLAPESLNVDKVDKLIPNLHDKDRYVIHHETLKLYLKLGLKLKRVHKGIKFTETDWLKQYIDHNTKLRTAATTNFEKDFFKLLNNSVFGKTMENIDNRVDVRIVNNEEELLKLTSKDTYSSTTVFDENMVAIHMKRTTLKQNKPIYVGMSILDLSKTIMYRFHYEHMKPKYEGNIKLLFTDTDSLMYEIKTEDLYKDMKHDLHLYDTSDYPKDHELFSLANKKVVGLMKDEACGKVITEFVGLRPKLYSFILDGEDHKKCKGVKKSVVESKITHQDYVDCLFEKKRLFKSMRIIRSKLHEVHTEEINKVALDPFDSKRKILEDGVSTLAYGHYKL